MKNTHRFPICRQGANQKLKSHPTTHRPKIEDDLLVPQDFHTSTLLGCIGWMTELSPPRSWDIQSERLRPKL